MEVSGINPCLGMFCQAPGNWGKEGHKYIFLSPEETKGTEGSTGRREFPSYEPRISRKIWRESLTQFV